MDIVYVLHSLAWNGGKNIKATQLLQLWMESYILIYFLSGHYICCLLFLLAGARACTHADIVLLEWWQEYQSNSTATTLDGLYILISFLSGHYICCLSFYLQACECVHTHTHTHTTLVGKIRNDNLAVKSFWRNSDIMLFHIQPRMQMKTRWSEMFW